MNLSWILLALALIAPDDQQPSTPKPPRSPITVQVEIKSPLANGAAACCQGATNAARTPISCPRDAPALVSTRPMHLPSVAAPRPQALQDAEDKETWPMTLREAIRIALDNNENVRVLAIGAARLPVGGFIPTTISAPEPIVISPLNADANPRRFKAEILAEVRSVEQQYWNLAQALVALKCADRAVELTQDVLSREQAELAVGHGTVADVAEAAQRFEQFTLDWVTRTSDVITTELGLRNLLGLPPADNRRIIPVSLATEAYVELDWEACFREMSEQEPELVQKKLALGSYPPMVVERGPANRLKFVRSRAQRHDEKVQQDDLRRVLQQKTHTLVRRLLEVDGGFEGFQTAKRLRQAAIQRLDAQRSEYEAGRITIDRFLDAISQYTTAVATENEHLVTYNISLAALAEAKGTLLAEDRIVIVDQAVSPAGSTRAPTNPATEDRQAKTASFEPDKSKGMVVPRIETSRNGPAATEVRSPFSKPEPPAACCETRSESAGTEAAVQPRTWTFSISIGGEKAIQIKGTITAAGDGQPSPTNP